MSSHRFDRQWVLGVGRVELRGRFTCLAGAGTVNAALVKGYGFGYAPVNGVNALQPTSRPGIAGTPGIVRTATGTYTLTLDDQYYDFEAANATILAPTGGGSAAEAQFNGAPTNLGINYTAGQAPTAPVFTIYTMNASGVLTDLGTTFQVTFQLDLINSTVQLQKP